MFHLQWQMDGHYGFRSEFLATEALAAVTRLADLGARWQPDGSDLRRFRRQLYFFDVTFSINLVRTLHEHKVCTPETSAQTHHRPKDEDLPQLPQGRFGKLAPRGPQSFAQTLSNSSRRAFGFTLSSSSRISCLAVFPVGPRWPLTSALLASAVRQSVVSVSGPCPRSAASAWPPPTPGGNPPGPAGSSASARCRSSCARSPSAPVPAARRPSAPA